MWLGGVGAPKESPQNVPLFFDGRIQDFEGISMQINIQDYVLFQSFNPQYP